jgi:hypothetical protein
VSCECRQRSSNPSRVLLLATSLPSASLPQSGSACLLISMSSCAGSTASLQDSRLQAAHPLEVCDVCCRSLPYNELTGPLPPSWGKVQSLQVSADVAQAPALSACCSWCMVSSTTSALPLQPLSMARLMLATHQCDMISCRGWVRWVENMCLSLLIPPDSSLLQDLKLNSNQLSGRVPLTWAGIESLSTV